MGSARHRASPRGETGGRTSGSRPTWSFGFVERSDHWDRGHDCRDRIRPFVRVFIDSNIPMYVAGREHPHREPSRRLLARVKRGEVQGCTSVEVLQEILYRYSALRRLDLAHEVYDLFVQICPVILSVTLAETDRARDLM